MDILEKIKPTKEEEQITLGRINQLISKIKVKDAKPVLGGSGAKGTWLKHTYDADIFVKFNYNKYKDKDISSILGNYLKNKFKITKLHGSRDYFQIKQKDFTFEIVPILDIKKAEQAKNITDVSPLHSSWVKKHINEKLADEIRIAKYFCKINNLYGAESYIKGFSGYVLEILIIRYKSFNNLIKTAKRWKPGTIIDIEKHNSAKRLNESKISPLIVIDPVQPDRNAAAALSLEKFDEFIRLANKKITFKEKKVDPKKYNLILEATQLKGKKDIAGAKLLKALQTIIKHLKDFNVKDYDWEWNDKATFYFKLQKTTLPVVVEHIGPPISAKENAEKFIKKYGKLKVYSKNKRLYVKLPVKNYKLKGFVKDLLREEFIKEKVKKIEIKSLK